MVLLTFMNLIYSLEALIQRGRSQRGQTFVEYSLLIGLIAIVAIAGMTAFQLSMANLYDKVKQVSDTMVKAVS